MTGIWQNDGSEWKLATPVGFPDEAALHNLVREAPQLLPLAGSPQLSVIGSEVPLGPGYADLLAVEPSGRLAIIEVKLARNAEARRAIVSQVLAYAAYLRGTEWAVLEGEIVRAQLADRGYSSISDTLAAADQAGNFDSAEFLAGLQESLSEGRFRLVLVLDAAPPELVKLVGYLESLGDKLVIDLVTVVSYDIGGSRVMVPQRVDPERPPETQQPRQIASGGKTRITEDAADFLDAIDSAKDQYKPLLRTLYDWAVSLQAEGLTRLRVTHGAGRKTLMPWLLNEQVGLVSIWSEGGFSAWDTVFSRRAPLAANRLADLVGGDALAANRTIRDVKPEVLDALTEAYREAAGRAVPAVVSSSTG